MGSLREMSGGQYEMIATKRRAGHDLDFVLCMSGFGSRTKAFKGGYILPVLTKFGMELIAIVPIIFRLYMYTSQ